MSKCRERPQYLDRNLCTPQYTTSTIRALRIILAIRYGASKSIEYRRRKRQTENSMFDRKVYGGILRRLRYIAFVGAAFFPNNPDLVEWVNSQLSNEPITYLGDGHDGVWNLFNQIGTNEQRREVLDWYHLIENLHKVGGSLKRLRRVESQLWQGSTVEAIAEFVGVRGKESENFQNYLRKHQSRIPNYQNYQNQGIDIGSGSVESLIKQIGARIKIVGAQWNEKNVPQILKLRCAYLNNDIKRGISAYLKSGMLPFNSLYIQELC